MSRNHCQRTVSFRSTEWGSDPITCKQRVGVRTWTDGARETRAACPRHFAELRRRYPEVAWTESELRLAAGDR